MSDDRALSPSPSPSSGRRYTPVFCSGATLHPAFDINDLSEPRGSDGRPPSSPTAAGMLRTSTDSLVPALTASQLVNNFLLMATAFSINHGTVTALIGLATTNLPPDTGNLQTGLLYTFYTLAALFGARSLILTFGDRLSIIGGLWGYVLYTASFIVADQVPSVSKLAAIIGGCIGGVASGFLWTAQFSYFGKNAALYAHALKLEENGTAAEPEDVDRAVSKFASWFALLYLSLEVFFKLLQSFVGESEGVLSAGWAEGKDMIYVINTACATLAVVACYWIADLDQHLEPQTPRPQSAQKSGLLTEVFSASRLFLSDPKMPLMTGMNLVFGFSTSFMNGYVTGIVVPFYIDDGSSYSGYLLALSATVAGMVTLPSSMGLISDMKSKRYMMVLAPACFATTAILPLWIGFGSVAGSTGWGLLALFVLQGLGRGVWESTNKAIFLDYFAHDKVGAGSMIIVQNGGATAVAFLISAYSPVRPTTSDCVTEGDCPSYALEAWTIIVFSVVAVVGFLLASRLYARGVDTWAAVLGDKTPLTEHDEEFLTITDHDELHDTHESVSAQATSKDKNRSRSDE